LRKFSLSGAKQKLLCILLITFFILINLFNFYIIEIGTTIRIAFLILSIVLSFLYAYVIFSSNLTIDTKNHLVTVKLFRKETIDLRDVNEIVVMDNVVQNKVVKAIAFYDEDQNLIGQINTFFTAKQEKLTKDIIEACRMAI